MKQEEPASVYLFSSNGDVSSVIALFLFITL